eukprot:scaffold319_cov17-Tisochrysis_lutea.AAC.2
MHMFTHIYTHRSGEVELEPRPGVVRVIDEAVDLGLKLAVCTTSKARDSLLSTLHMLLGEERTAKLDCVLAGMTSPLSALQHHGSRFDI